MLAEVVLALNDWFTGAKRDFPWRKDPSPYKVWISEVMLQQTQASVVEKYFNRWMRVFPNIQALAAAPESEVVKAWEGLGYYSRARNLHAAAKTMMEKFSGEIPSDPAALQMIRGLGPYTIGALQSFAFHRKAAAVDGNVARVIARYYQIEEVICREPVKKRIWELTQNLLPEEKPWVTMEALIELGALVCKRNPVCSECPLNGSCQSHLSGIAPSLPKKNKRPQTQKISRAVAVLIYKDEVLVRQETAGRVMAGLYEFPYVEGTTQELEHLIGAELQLIADCVEELPRVAHTFTRFKVDLAPSRWSVKTKKNFPGMSWIPLNQAESLPFSSGHRRILQDLMHRINHADFAY